MRVAARLKAVITDRGLLGRPFQTVVVPIVQCQCRPQNYSTADGTNSSTDASTIPDSAEVPKRRRPGRPRRTPEENALAALEKERKRAEKAAAKGLPPLSKALGEDYAKLYEEPAVFMKPMRRPVGRPFKIAPPPGEEEPPEPESPKLSRKRGVGRPKKRGRRPGSKNKPKPIGPRLPQKTSGRPKLIGPKYPTAGQKAKMAYCAGIPLSELVFGIPKDEIQKDPEEELEELEELEPEGTEKLKPRRKPRKNRTWGTAEPLEAGRPRKHGPELPSKIIIDQGVEKRVYLRPGRYKLFFSEEEREDKEFRQAREELVKEAVFKRRKDIAEYGISEDGAKKKRKTPLKDEVVVKIVKKELNRQTGPKAYEISELTRAARDFLASRKEEVDEEEQDREWEYLLDDEGQPIIPKKSPGGNTRHKLSPAKVKKSKWDGTTKITETGGEGWRQATPKKLRNSAPTIASLIEAGIPQPKPPTDKSLVIGEKKCADIFERFDFSEYEGCDVIDFNPGYGVFSRELNKAIKPSKHILLEHEAEFVPFLEETCTDSSFEIVRKDFYDWATFDDLIKNGKINPKKVPFEEGVNKTLLVTGMLHKEVKGDRFMAQILDAIAQKTWVFRYGRVKFLLWVDEEMVARYLPRTFGRRNRAAVMVEAFTDLREIASPPPFYTWADHRFFFRMDIWDRPDHVPNKQDAATGVKYAKQLKFISMDRDPPPVTFEPEEYWPPLRWAQTTLLDFTPKLTSPYLRGDVPDSEPWKFFNLFLTSSFLSRHTLMRNVLSKVGEGAEQMFETEESLKKFPDLPDKPAVHVSVEELEALAQAYEFWPWRSDDPFLGTDMRLSRPGMLEELEDAQILL
ncbi:Mitochondrial transcription factor 1 [Orbilia javanica]|uniref:rRNA adenine N(6)-methyltransferase n=1 Tax=Orbilia javanica TaxID=47235 RepID=A0AAN8RSI3_9PEZI